MAGKIETSESAGKAAKQEARAQKKEARAQKAAESGKGDRAAKLCAFATVDVKKSEAGYQFRVRGSDRLFKFTLAPQEVGPVLKDLESAIQVVRGQV